MRNSFPPEKCFNPDDEQVAKECPAFLALSLIANKWSIKILYSLMTEKNRTLRFGQIQKALDTITQRELTKQLREFERSGLITRKIYPEVPPRVEYTLTALGDSLLKPVEQLSAWADKNAKTVQKNRDAFEKKSAAKEKR